jgi:CDP-glucose 4,6-dehydratase
MSLLETKFWKGRSVFVTGHTGFKGSWLCLVLSDCGAKVTGYSLSPPTRPSLFECAKVKASLEKHVIGDVRNADRLNQALSKAKPHLVIHMAAQPIVLESYKNPVETFSTNVMGTVNVLEAVRRCRAVKAVINVTSDKCYDNKERLRGYRESEPLGGKDPYSSSKACSELVTAAYRYSFFNDSAAAAIATARSGNVIGGGDWAQHRLVPDCIRAFLGNRTVTIRNPRAIRPWQHVLESLNGYLLLAQKLLCEGEKYAQAWNFGGSESDAGSAQWVVSRLCKKWGGSANFVLERAPQPLEASRLMLDSSRAVKALGWKRRWTLDQALDKTVEWAKGYEKGEDPQRMCCAQIRSFVNG